jgi:hypothetical protein
VLLGLFSERTVFLCDSGGVVDFFGLLVLGFCFDLDVSEFVFHLFARLRMLQIVFYFYKVFYYILHYVC